MFKRSFALLSAASLLLAVGCNDISDGGSVPLTEEPTAEITSPVSETAVSPEIAEAEEDEHVLRILADYDSLMNLTEQCYPDYIKIDTERAGEYVGQIGDTKVIWMFCPPNADWDYNGAVKYRMEEQDNASAYEKIDLVVADCDMLPNFMANGYALPLSEIGITEADTAEMYPYTISAGSYNGELMAVMYETAPVVFAYKRGIAQEVLGTDDPDTVARHIMDMEAFTNTAERMKNSGYHILSTKDDLWYAFAGDISPAVISGSEALLDPDIYRWSAYARQYADNGYITDASLWSEKWAEGMTVQSDVFGYFMPSWGVYWTLPANADWYGGGESSGDYAVCAPTSSSCWGGSYIFAARGTDDPELAAEFIRTLCFNKDTAKAMMVDSGQYIFANHMEAMEEAAAESEGEEFYGGQNVLAVLHESALNISAAETTRLGIRINEKYQSAMRDYILGKTTYDEAIALFKEDSYRIIAPNQGG